MKYSEFLQLNELLNSKGTTLPKELDLNEADDEKPTVSTETGHWFTKWGRMKNRLNRGGKKHLAKLNKTVISKYLPKLLETELETVNIIIKAAKENKTPKDIMNLVHTNITRTKDIQSKQFNIVMQTVDQYLINIGKQLVAKIEKSKMSENNKTDLKNYWLLLKTQIVMNSLSYMQKAITDKCKEAIGDNATALQIYEASKKDKDSLLGTLTSVFNTKKEESNKQKEVVKDANERAKTEGTQPTEKAPVKPEVGKKYEYTNNKGDKYTLEITKTNKDGSFQGKTTDGKPTTVAADMVKKLVPVIEKVEGERETEL